MRFLLLSILLSLTLGACVGNVAESEENALGQTSRAERSPTRDLSDWRPGEYLGIVTGKTTIDKVREELGAPDFEGSNSEKVDARSPVDEILVQYKNVNNGEGALDLIADAKSRTVIAMALYVRGGMTVSDVISKFGSNFREVDSAASMCSPDEMRGPERLEGQSRKTLVYPQLGMYASFYAQTELRNSNTDKSLIHIGFLAKCFDGL